MRLLLKTHSHTSERPGYEARKNAKKVIEGSVDTIRRQTIHQSLPRTASVAGGAKRRRHYGKTNHRQNPPAYRRRGGGGETKKGELKENTVAKTRKTKVKTLPQATIVAGGARQEAKTNTLFTALALTATVATPFLDNIAMQYMTRHKWRSCNKFGITDTFFCRADSTRWFTYPKA